MNADFVPSPRNPDSTDPGRLSVANHLKLLDVALEVGFNSQSTFYNQFKKRCGVTPKKFRDASSPVGSVKVK